MHIPYYIIWDLIYLVFSLAEIIIITKGKKLHLIILILLRCHLSMHPPGELILHIANQSVFHLLPSLSPWLWHWLTSCNYQNMFVNKASYFPIAQCKSLSGWTPIQSGIKIKMDKQEMASKTHTGVFFKPFVKRDTHTKYIRVQVCGSSGRDNHETIKPGWPAVLFVHKTFQSFSLFFFPLYCSVYLVVTFCSIRSY